MNARRNLLDNLAARRCRVQYFVSIPRSEFCKMRNWETLSCKVITFRPVLVLIEYQFQRLRANIGVYFMLEANFMQSLYFVEKNAGKLSVSKGIRILKALKFSGEKFWPYSTGFLIYHLKFFSCGDLPAWRYRFHLIILVVGNLQSKNYT